MELYQVRYFLALASTLNFTRAAEMCCVTQPALTRAIQALEFEMGGRLITRERRLSHLTELGQRLLPVLERTYRGAMAAKALARTCVDGATLRLALTSTVDLGCLMRPLRELIAKFPNVEVDVLRGSAEEVLEYLKSGEVDIAIADIDLGSWERLDSWLVDRIPYCLVANSEHPFAGGAPIPVSAIVGERLICLPHCSLARELLETGAPDQRRVCQVATLGDIFTMLKLNAGVALLPRDIDLPDGLVRIETTGFPLEHSTYLYAVAGRQRTKSAGAFVDFFARRSRRNSANKLATALPGRRSRKKSVAGMVPSGARPFGAFGLKVPVPPSRQFRAAIMSA